MNGLVKIDYTNDRPTVLGRELHNMLEVETPYSMWIKRMFEYGFAEGTDYMTVNKNVIREDGSPMPQTQHDHQLTIEMAKEIAMLQRTERGKQVRQYFIQLEKDWNTPEKIMARALNIANRTLEEFKNRTLELEAKVEEQKPKVIFAESVVASDGTILIRELAKLITQNGVKIGEERLFQWMRDNGYLIRKKGADYNTPTQRSAELGILTISKTVINKPDGTILVRQTPRVTGKGQIYFINKFKEAY